jgi:periodic tryptophan protein 1
MSKLISCTYFVKRGVAARHPSKYLLDEKELERVSVLARIELEDARVELERASKIAQEMGKGVEDEIDDESGPEEYGVFEFSLFESLIH